MRASKTQGQLYHCACALLYNGTERTVKIAGGEYRVYVRYGKSPNYRYTKGEAFEIRDSAYTYTVASLTLHGVIYGNYHTYGSSKAEFDRQ